MKRPARYDSGSRQGRIRKGKVMSTPATLDPPCTNAAERYPKLAELISYLESLGTRANLGVLDRLLSGLSLSRADIAPACIFGTKSYRRNTIARGDHFELLALCWRSGHVTPIHDHQGSSCAFRVIEGRGTEIRYMMSPAGIVCPTGAVEMPPGYVCAAHDDDIHQVANLQPAGTDLVTLHIYSPAIQKMNTYENAAVCKGESDSAEC